MRHGLDPEGIERVLKAPLRAPYQREILLDSPWRATKEFSDIPIIDREKLQRGVCESCVGNADLEEMVERFTGPTLLSMALGRSQIKCGKQRWMRCSKLV